MHDDEEVPEWVDRANDLLDEGQWEQALLVLDAAPADHGLRWLLSSAVWIEVDRLDRADEDLAKAQHLLGDGDPDVLRARGRLEIARWNFDGARAAFALLDPREWGAQLLLDRSFLADAEGDHDRAHDLLTEAHALDPEHNPPPIRLSSEDFEAIVSEAVSELPDEFVRVVERIPIVIDPMPTAAVLDAPRSGHPPDVLGLYIGPPLSEYDTEPGLEQPPAIFLFQRNLERIGEDVEHLREEIRVTLYHELGHALGFDEDGVDDLGLA